MKNEPRFKFGEKAYYIGYTFWGKPIIKHITVEWYINCKDVIVMYGEGCISNAFRSVKLYDKETIEIIFSDVKLLKRYNDLGFR